MTDIVGQRIFDGPQPLHADTRARLTNLLAPRRVHPLLLKWRLASLDQVRDQPNLRRPFPPPYSRYLPERLPLLQQFQRLEGRARRAGMPFPAGTLSAPEPFEQPQDFLAVKFTLLLADTGDLPQFV